jgi:outer membrane protein assembly factor BamB
VYVTIGSRPGPGSNGYANAIVALDPKMLTVKGWFTPPDTELVTPPVVFEIGERGIVAAAARDGSTFLLDTSSLGGSTHDVALGRASAARVGATSFVPGGIATWEDSAGTRWLLVPTATALSAMKVTSRGGVPALEAGWTSRAIQAPLVPLVVNGVVFVASSGGPAVLHALGGATGRELWNSGNTIASVMHAPAIWAGIGQIHVATYDDTVYAFGFAMERD